MSAVALVGIKVGMTRIFNQNGRSVPVTVIKLERNKISQIKTIEGEGYNSLQISVGEKKPSRVTKPVAGHVSKAQVPAGFFFKEFKVANAENYALGQELSVELLKEVSHVDVSGITKGKGFAGCVKRHGFRTQDATHGNSVSHRAPGSIGQNQTPGRVFKGKKMAGHLGNVKRTVQSLEVVSIDEENRLILVKGAIPGSRGGYVIVKPAVKKIDSSSR